MAETDNKNRLCTTARLRADFSVETADGRLWLALKEGDQVIATPNDERTPDLFSKRFFNIYPVTDSSRSTIIGNEMLVFEH